MSLRLLDLPDALRAGGVDVQTYDGWESRGSSSWGPVLGIICHATGSSLTRAVSSELAELAIHGTPSAPEVPISQIFVSRAGVWWVIASGKATGVLKGWGGPLAGHSDEAVIQIEAAHHDGNEAWTEAQYQSYARGCAALCKHYNLPVDHVVAHREHQPGAKNDPEGIDMVAFRALVQAYLSGQQNGASAMWAKVKDEGDNVLAMQIDLVDLGVHIGPIKDGVPVLAPADQPYKYCDSQYGEWCTRAVKETCGGDGTVYGPWQRATVQRLLRAKGGTVPVEFKVTGTVSGTVSGNVSGSVSGSARPTP